MNYGMYISGLGALAQEARLTVVANNLANVNTPAYRRDQITFQERLVEALEDRPDMKYYNSLVHRHGGAPFISDIRFDRDPGGYDATGRPLDLAISGDGFFVVRERGTKEPLFYTRAGNFLFNAEGRLVTADGRYEVLDSGGFEAITMLDTLPADFVIDRDGTIWQAGQEPLATLAVRDFDDYDRLRKRGDMLYTDQGAGARPAAGYGVRQGTLETSSANPLVEMVEMIKATRLLETNLQMVRLQDATLDRVVNDFGRLQR